MNVCHFLTFCEMTKSEMTHFWHHWLFESMPFAKENKILIKMLFHINNYNAKDLVREIPSKCWNAGLVYKSLQKLRIAGSGGHRPRSCRRHSARTADNIDLVYELVSHKWLNEKYLHTVANDRSLLSTKIITTG